MILIMSVLMYSTVYADEPSSWAEEGIESLEEKGYFDSSFFTGYQNNITRQEFAYLSVRLFEVLQGKDITVDPDIHFSDTTDVYALKAATVGISSGVGDDRFDPDASLTREQLAVMMIKTLNLGKLDLSLQFKDAFNDNSSFSSWAKDSIDVAYANGIISGTGNNTFSPSGYATKEQAMVIVNNILRNYSDKSFQFEAFEGPVLTMSIEDRYDASNKAAFVKVYCNHKYVGYTNNEGQLPIYNLTPGFNNITMLFRDGTIVQSGAYSYETDRTALMWIDSKTTDANSEYMSDEAIKEQVQTIVLEETVVDPSQEVTVLFDDSIPKEVEKYINKLLEEARPIINNLLGAPNNSHTYTLKYSPTEHLGYNTGKTISTMSVLPELVGDSDPDFDKWMINEYIHQYLKDYGIPIKGSRSNESRAQALSDIVMNLMDRDSNQNGLNYYLDLYDILLPLGPEFILNNGSTTQSGAFNPYNFNWTPESYNQVNALGLEHHKALWHKLFEQRYKETGKYDFFVVYMKEMNTGAINTPEKYYGMMDGLINQVDGIKTSEWLKQAPEYAGQLDEEYAVRVLPLKGGMLSIEGVDNPDNIYPLLIKRSPGELIEDTCRITITEDSNVVYDADFNTEVGMGNLSGALNIRHLNLIEGLYTVTVSWQVNNQTLKDSRAFQIGEVTIPTESLKDMTTKNLITIKYDESIPENVRKYVTALQEIIDPICRFYVGEPNEAGTFTLKYDPNGFNTMSNHYSTLNITKLPNTSGVDINFDAFFFIEYFHMFHKGESMPFEIGRYSENISQLMKIIISDHLSQNNIREIGSRDLDYFVRFFDYTDDLGPNILINMGVLANGGPTSRANWEMDPKYGQFMNVFTLDYGLSVWAKLDNARYLQTSKHDFVKEVMLALRNDDIKSLNDFYEFLDETVITVDDMKASTWLKQTSLFSELTDEIYTLKLLPVNGDVMNISGNDNPTTIYPFLVERDGLASVEETEVTISVYEGNEKLLEESVMMNIGSNYNSYNGLDIRHLNLSEGVYTVEGKATVNGQLIKSQVQFEVK